MLRAIAADIALPQTREAQHDKSHGKALQPADAPRTAAQTHALLRAHAGFDINQLVSEYRALRASVLRQWMDHLGEAKPDPDEIIRFNEAIDQAVAESVAAFSASAEQARNLLLGMLGHDMRSPLQTIQVTAGYLTTLGGDERISAAASRLICSGARMQALLDDLVDFNRTQLGLGIRVHPKPVDLAADVASEIEQLRAGHPDRTIELSTRGDAHGDWDAMRLRQCLSNLVLNALRHGDGDGTVRVRLDGSADQVTLEVENQGPVLDPVQLLQLFEPLASASRPDCREDGHSLGLGLYICREVARAHGGDIVASSDAAATRFVVTLPRRAPASP